LETFVASTAGLTGDVTSMCLPFPVLLRSLRCTQRPWSQQQCADCLAAVFRRNFSELQFRGFRSD